LAYTIPIVKPYHLKPIPDSIPKDYIYLNIYLVYDRDKFEKAPVQLLKKEYAEL